MNISDVAAMSTYSLRQAIGTSMIMKASAQDMQSLETIKKMASDVANSTGVGKNFDMTI